MPFSLCLSLKIQIYTQANNWMSCDRQKLLYWSFWVALSKTFILAMLDVKLAWFLCTAKCFSQSYLAKNIYFLFIFWFVNIMCWYISTFILLSIKVTFLEKQPHTMMFSPPNFTVWRLWGWCLLLTMPFKDFRFGLILPD